MQHNGLVQDGYQIHIEAIATSLIIFGACMGILPNIKVKTLLPIEWSYRSLNYVDYWAQNSYHILSTHVNLL